MKKKKGKTTLLNALAGRSGAKTKGEILINGKPKLKSLVDNAGYVMQYDVLLSNITVIETLTYASELRMPKRYSKEEKSQIVEDLIKQMGIFVCRETMVGGKFIFFLK